MSSQQRETRALGPHKKCCWLNTNFLGIFSHACLTSKDMKRASRPPLDMPPSASILHKFTLYCNITGLA